MWLWLLKKHGTQTLHAARTADVPHHQPPPRPPHLNDTLLLRLALHFGIGHNLGGASMLLATQTKYYSPSLYLIGGRTHM